MFARMSDSTGARRLIEVAKQKGQRVSRSHVRRCVLRAQLNQSSGPSPATPPSIGGSEEVELDVVLHGASHLACHQAPGCIRESTQARHAGRHAEQSRQDRPQNDVRQINPSDRLHQEHRTLAWYGLGPTLSSPYPKTCGLIRTVRGKS